MDIDPQGGGRPPRPSTPYRILAVCTGNICRSPAVERLMTARLPPGAGVVISSAGTHALVGSPVDPPMARLVTAAGGDVSGFRARLLTGRTLEGADLVLALTREHRAAVVGLAPTVVRRTFTLRELARLAEGIDEAELRRHGGASAPPAERLRALVRLATRQRIPVDADLDDVVDPYGRPVAVHADALDLIIRAVDAILRGAGLP